MTATHLTTTGSPRKSLDKIKDTVEFMQHQVDDAREGMKMNSFIIGSSMGVGKTLVAETVVAIDFQMGWASRVCVVCEATLKWNWAAELERDTNFTYVILDGTPDQREKQLQEYEESGADFLIVNPEQLRCHLDDLNRLKFDFALIDEAHGFNNPRSERSKALLEFVTTRTIWITGSVMLNNVNELWMPLHRIDPGRFPDYFKFIHRFCIWGGYKDKQIIGVKNERQLTEVLHSVMLRRDKSILGLPGRVDEPPVMLDLLPEQRTLYREAVDELKITVPGMEDLEIENALVKGTRLKQICATTATIPGCDDHSAKLDWTVVKIKELVDAGEPVVVFTQFRPVIAGLERRLDEVGIAHYSLHGGINKKDRVPLCKQWADDAADGKPAAMLSLYKVAGVGLNMVAAQHVIRVDKLYVPKLNDQAVDRCNRFGQTRVVHVWDPMCRNTIEARIEQILRRKEKLFGVIVASRDIKRAVYEALREEGE